MSKTFVGIIAVVTFVIGVFIGSYYYPTGTKVADTSVDKCVEILVDGNSELECVYVPSDWNVYQGETSGATDSPGVIPVTTIEKGLIAPTSGNKGIEVVRSVVSPTMKLREDGERESITAGWLSTYFSVGSLDQWKTNFEKDKLERSKTPEPGKDIIKTEEIGGGRVISYYYEEKMSGIINTIYVFARKVMPTDPTSPIMAAPLSVFYVGGDQSEDGSVQTFKQLDEVARKIIALEIDPTK